MVEPDYMYVVDSKGARKIPAKKFNQNSVAEGCWCLVDSNYNLTTVPDNLLDLGSFVIQTASPRDDRVDWSKKTSHLYTPFFMKEWSLPELIVGYTFLLIIRP
jgi:hypothetical protein